MPPNFEGDMEAVPLGGESCSVVNDVKPAAAIVRDLARDAAAAGQPQHPVTAAGSAPPEASTGACPHRPGGPCGGGLIPRAVQVIRVGELQQGWDLSRPLTDEQTQQMAARWFL
jgi:hypothetical protein